MKPLFWRDLSHTHCSYLTNTESEQMGHVRRQDDGQWTWDNDEGWAGLTSTKKDAQDALVKYWRARATMILAALPREVA